MVMVMVMGMGMGTTDVNGVFKAPTKQVTEYRWQYLGPATVRQRPLAAT